MGHGLIILLGGQIARGHLGPGDRLTLRDPCFQFAKVAHLEDHVHPQRSGGFVRREGVADQGGMVGVGRGTGGGDLAETVAQGDAGSGGGFLGGEAGRHADEPAGGQKRQPAPCGRVPAA